MYICYKGPQFLVLPWATKISGPALHLGQSLFSLSGGLTVTLLVPVGLIQFSSGFRTRPATQINTKFFLAPCPRQTDHSQHLKKEEL